MSMESGDITRVYYSRRRLQYRNELMSVDAILDVG